MLNNIKHAPLFLLSFSMFLYHSNVSNPVSDKFISTQTMRNTHLDFGEELAEAATRIDLQTLGELQDELHDDGLMCHLLHERVFLTHTHTHGSITHKSPSTTHTPARQIHTHMRYLLHLQVDAHDDQIVCRFLTDQVRIVRQVLLRVVPAPQHPCAHTHTRELQ